MPRKKPAEAAETSGEEQLTHPLFPHVPTASIALLKVTRLVVERRKGHPGFGLGEPPRVNLTPSGVPPSVIVGDDTLAKDYGPGVYEVFAMGARGRFAAGAPYRTKIPDEGGHVPMYVDEFEPEAPDPAQVENTGAESVMELRAENRVLKVMLEGERRAAQDREAFFKTMLNEQRAGFKDTIGGVSTLVDRVLSAQSAPAAQSQSDPYVKALLEAQQRSDKELRELRGDLVKAQVKASGKGGEDDGEGWGKFLFAAIPEVMGTLKKRGEVEEKRLELEERKLKLREGSGVVIDGETLPPLSAVEKLVRAGKAPKGEGLQVFRDLHERRMLPPAYAKVLKRWLPELPDDDAAGETSGASAGAGDAGGAVAG